MDYLALLEHSYKKELENSDQQYGYSRLEFLADHIFDFTTYESEYSELFAQKAIEVCRAINQRKTFDYDRQWYLLMCNMPFFCDRLEWGTSIRGAWWGMHQNHPTTELVSCGLWVGDDQVTSWFFNTEEWKRFILAIVEFAESGKE